MSKPLPRIGVDRLYYAPITSDTESGTVYGSPVWMQGVSEIGYKPNSQHVPYYADDGLYAASVADGKVEVEVKVADLLPSVYAYLMGVTQKSNGKIEEGNADIPPEVAIGYRSMKQNGSYRYEWLLKGVFIKPEQTSKTKSDGVEMQEAAIKFYPMNRVSDGKTRNRYDSDDALAPTGLTDAALISADTGWFSSPDYEPVAPGTPISDLVAATGTSDGEISLTFSAAASATSVKAQVQDAALGTWVDAATAAAITAASVSAVITGLTEGNTYNCRLVVIGGTKNGISNTASAAAKAGV